MIYQKEYRLRYPLRREYLFYHICVVEIVISLSLRTSNKKHTIQTTSGLLVLFKNSSSKVNHQFQNLNNFYCFLLVSHTCECELDLGWLEKSCNRDVVLNNLPSCVTWLSEDKQLFRQCCSALPLEIISRFTLSELLCRSRWKVNKTEVFNT